MAPPLTKEIFCQLMQTRTLTRGDFPEATHLGNNKLWGKKQSGYGDILLAGLQVFLDTNGSRKEIDWSDFLPETGSFPAIPLHREGTQSCPASLSFSPTP